MKTRLTAQTQNTRKNENKAKVPHFNFKAADHTLVVAILLSGLVCGLIVAGLSAVQVADYTAGSWVLFG